VRKPTLDKTTIVKTMSRAQIGTVPVTRVVPQKKKLGVGAIKHKKRELVQEEEI
jgi:hypothetical protein